MKKMFFALAASLIGFSVMAQQPPAAPPGEVAPPPVPEEGQKNVDPKNARGKPVAPPPMKSRTKKMPVKPPTPETIAPDQPQDGIH